MRLVERYADRKIVKPCHDQLITNYMLWRIFVAREELWDWVMHMCPASSGLSYSIWRAEI